MHTARPGGQAPTFQPAFLLLPPAPLHTPTAAEGPSLSVASTPDATRAGQKATPTPPGGGRGSPAGWASSGSPHLGQSEGPACSGSRLGRSHEGSLEEAGVAVQVGRAAAGLRTPPRVRGEPFRLGGVKGAGWALARRPAGPAHSPCAAARGEVARVPGAAGSRAWATFPPRVRVRPRGTFWRSWGWCGTGAVPGPGADPEELLGGGRRACQAWPGHPRPAELRAQPGLSLPICRAGQWATARPSSHGRRPGSGEEARPGRECSAPSGVRVRREAAAAAPGQAGVGAGLRRAGRGGADLGRAPGAGRACVSAVSPGVFH